MRRTLLLRFLVIGLGVAACGKDKAVVQEDDHAAPVTHPAAPAPDAPPPDAMPSAEDYTKMLVRDEAAWQKTVEQGPPDAYCAKAAVVADDVKGLIARRAAADPRRTQDAIDLVAMAFDKITPEACADEVRRMTYGLMVHVGASHHAPLASLPYRVPAALQAQMDLFFAAPTTGAQSDFGTALQILGADVDAQCACKDKTCFIAAAVKTGQDARAMINANLTGTEAQGDQMHALMQREHDCATKFIGANAQ